LLNTNLLNLIERDLIIGAIGEVAKEYSVKEMQIRDPTTLILIDEADRLRMASLEQVRAIFDAGAIGVILERLGEAGAGFRSVTEAIDTTTPAGRMMMQMVGAFAEFERAMLRERTKVGLDAAREEGRIGGRRPKLSAQQQTEIRKMITKGDKTAAAAARLFKVHPATVSRLLGTPQEREIYVR